MRIALCFIILCTALANGVLFAEEEGLVSARFDVSALIVPYAQQHGGLIGSPTPHERMNNSAPEVGEPRQFFNIDTLCELVRYAVEPRTWEQIDGAMISGEDRWLRVRNRPEVIKKVESYLYQLGLELQQRLLLRVEVFEGQGDAFPSTKEGTPLTASGSLPLVLGVQRALKRTSRVRFVSEYEVEIAQGSNIANPVVVSVEEGMIATMRATPTSDGERVVLEGLVQSAKYGTPRRVELGMDEEHMPSAYKTDRRMPYGILELPEYTHAQSHFTAVVPTSGATVNVPLVIRGRQVTFRVAARLKGRGSMSKIIDLRSITQRPMPVIFGKLSDSGTPIGSIAPRVLFLGDGKSDPWPQPAYAHAENIVDELRSALDPVYWEEKGSVELLPFGRIHVNADEKHLADVRSFVGQLEGQALRPVVMDLRVWSRAGHGAASATESFVRDGARLVAAGRVPTLLGRTASLMAGSTANFVADYDVEVAQEARIADPIVGQSFDGLIANLRPELGPSRQSVNLHLQMLLARRVIDTQPHDSQTKFLGTIDKVRQDRTVAETVVQLTVGGSHVLDLGIDPEDKTRRLFAEIRIELP